MHKQSSPNIGTTVVFLHVPKSAGLTLNDVLRRQYKRSATYSFDRGRHYLKSSIERFQKLSEEERGQLSLLHGHAPFGIHKFVPNPCTYITILRNPIDRIISHYYYVLNNSNHLLHAELIARSMSLKDYVTSGITTELDNDQVRLLSGVGNTVDVGLCSHEMLEQAIVNAEAYFSAVGLTERFDETLLIMKKALKWNWYPFYTKQNVSRYRPRHEKITGEVRRQIETINALDCELYEYAKKRFEKDVRMVSENELKAYVTLNSIYYPFGKMFSVARAVRRSLKAIEL